MIVDDAISSAKIDDNTIIAADVVAGQITNVEISAASGAEIAQSKVSGLGTAASLNVGTGANQIVQMDSTPKLPALNGSALTNLSSGNLTGDLPALNGSAVTNLTAANLTGVLPVLDGTQLTGIVTDFTPIENQLSRLGLHLGAVEQLAKFNMIDQVIDDYEDATGVTANNATSDVYGNITNSTSGLWLGATSDFTYTGANVVQNSGDKATWMNVTFSGDFDVTFTKTGSSNDFMCGLNLVSDESGKYIS